jgi:hypothetical protein
MNESDQDAQLAILADSNANDYRVKRMKAFKIWTQEKPA